MKQLYQLAQREFWKASSWRVLLHVVIEGSLYLVTLHLLSPWGSYHSARGWILWEIGSLEEGFYGPSLEGDISLCSYSTGHNSVMWSLWTTMMMRKMYVNAKEEENKSILKSTRSFHHKAPCWPSYFWFTLFFNTLIILTFFLKRQHKVPSSDWTNSKSRMSESIISV